MHRRAFLGVLGAVALVPVLTAPTLSATSCSIATPAGASVTTDCTWIVRQVDPGIFLDNAGNYWVMKDGHPVKVKLEDMRIGVETNGKPSHAG